MSLSRPIGVFDSGVGGLTVLAAIRRQMPTESLSYFADSRFAPYGEKTAEAILERCRLICAFFQRQDTKAIVIACNTATAAAASELRRTLIVPVIGIEPGLKPAVAASKNKIIGILATTSTLRSRKYAALAEGNSQGARVLSQPCPGLVEIIERGGHKSEEARFLVKRYLEPLLLQGADTIVLGCTHFPLIAPLIEDLTQGRVTIIETGLPVARHLENQLDRLGLLAPVGASGGVSVRSSAPGDKENDKLQAILRELSLGDCTLECGVEI